MSNSQTYTRYPWRWFIRVDVSSIDVMYGAPSSDAAQGHDGAHNHDGTNGADRNGHNDAYEVRVVLQCTPASSLAWLF